VTDRVGKGIPGRDADRTKEEINHRVTEDTEERDTEKSGVRSQESGVRGQGSGRITL